MQSLIIKLFIVVVCFTLGGENAKIKRNVDDFVAWPQLVTYYFTPEVPVNPCPQFPVNPVPQVPVNSVPRVPWTNSPQTQHKTVSSSPNYHQVPRNNPAKTQHMPVSSSTNDQNTSVSYTNSSINVGSPQELCREDEFQCNEPKQCYKKKLQCDGIVNCVDGSDEQDCTCASRLSPMLLCDNFEDCEDGSDEMGCFGCGEKYFSCHSSDAEFNNDSNRPNCFNASEKCDALSHCPNEKDEEGCVMIGNEDGTLRRSTDGILYRNFRGVWYPVCVDAPGRWAVEACRLELGIELPYHAHYEEPAGDIGKWISMSLTHRHRITDECIALGLTTKKVLRIKCNETCGIRVEHNRYKPQARIAGGKEALPTSWPWIAAIYANNTLICGSSIIGKKWVVTAAHCMYSDTVRLGEYTYIEIRAGNTHLNSLNTREQAVRVSRSIVHEGFNIRDTDMKNDIALLELAEELVFNRWVQAICLPTAISVGRISDWIWGPSNGTTCSTAGWGGYTARGPHQVNQLMEVDLQWMGTCDPNDTGSICAGYPEGGFDICEGDSGGPLVCPSAVNSVEFYLGGIASSEYSSDRRETKCGEKGVYGSFTNVGLFIQWIEWRQDPSRETNSNTVLHGANCKGINCAVTNRCAVIRDGKVDCPDAKDENLN